MKNYNVEELETVIRANGRWQNMWKENVPVDEIWNIMYNIVFDAINVLCPTVRRLVQTDKPGWVTKQVRESIREKNVLYMRAVESKAETDWDAFRVK